MIIPIQGHANSKFEHVVDIFQENFKVRGDRGAACCIVIDGVIVVDIWAGLARNDMAWRRQTKTPVFSVSKGITAVALLVAAQDGHIDLEAPVSRYWPEFGVNGKSEVTVRETLAHRAGIPAFGTAWNEAELKSWFPVVEDLAQQTPLWKPGSSYVYHPISVGFIAGEILRRATGQRPAEWLRKVNRTIGTRLAFGAHPSDVDLALVASPVTPEPDANVPPEFLPLVTRAFLADGAYGPDLFTAANKASFLQPESPAANLVATARDLALFYEATVSDARTSRILTDDAVADATVPVSYGKPFVGDDQGVRWGTGIMLPSARRGFAGEGSFGHDGAGGQIAFASLEHRMGFAYVTNQPGTVSDDRAEKLSAAVRNCL